MAILIGVISISPSIAPVSAETSYTIDFEAEGLGAGTTVSTLSCGFGIDCPPGAISGFVSVNANNQTQGILPTDNTAMIFNSNCVRKDNPDQLPGTCSGDDDDLSFPNNGNTLINSEDLKGENPDDQNLPNSFMEFDFAKFGPGTVTITSIQVGDIELPREGGAFVESHESPCAGHPLPEGTLAQGLLETGDNVIKTNDLIGFSDVQCFHVHLNGSGAVDNINFTVTDQSTPDIDIRKQAEGPDSRTFNSGDDVIFEIEVANTGDVDLENVVVTDVLTTGCDNDLGALAAGASVKYTCIAPAVTVAFTNEACVDGSSGGVTVTDCDPSTVEILSLQARITGGWHVKNSDGDDVRSRGGFTLHCDIELSNNMNVTWDKGQHWHINKLVDAAFCIDDPEFTPGPPVSPADTYFGLDVGRLNNKDGSVACFKLEDHGEVSGDPDGPDQILLRIWKVGFDPGISAKDLRAPGFDCLVSVSDPTTDPNTVLYVSESDIEGNLQFHEDQPHKKGNN